MYGVKASDELKQEELEEARLGFIQFLRRKRFSPQFIETHGDDLFATAALEYSRKLAEGEEIDTPAGWLITCAWRRTKSQLEAEGRRPHLVSVDSGAQVADENSRDPQEAVLDDDRFRKVREAVDQLSVDQRRLLALSYFEGLTVREAGRALQWHASKAQRAHEGARRKLHDLLGVTSSDDLAVEIGLAAYVSLTAGATTGNLLERAARKSTETLALGQAAGRRRRGPAEAARDRDLLPRRRPDSPGRGPPRHRRRRDRELPRDRRRRRYLLRRAGCEPGRRSPQPDRLDR